jgi:hypothetical protein
MRFKGLEVSFRQARFFGSGDIPVGTLAACGALKKVVPDA